jgi:hypothetical protein
MSAPYHPIPAGMWPGRLNYQLTRCCLAHPSKAAHLQTSNHCSTMPIIAHHTTRIHSIIHTTLYVPLDDITSSQQPATNSIKKSPQKANHYVQTQSPNYRLTIYCTGGIICCNHHHKNFTCCKWGVVLRASSKSSTALLSIPTTTTSRSATRWGEATSASHSSAAP